MTFSDKKKKNLCLNYTFYNCLKFVTHLKYLFSWIAWTFRFHSTKKSINVAFEGKAILCLKGNTQWTCVAEDDLQVMELNLESMLISLSRIWFHAKQKKF